ncbi:FGGY-family carbohydrate kinase [Salinicola endophyticus]|uniref:FGGY-family carbohydrate kinase n=1 Tax=Salinicola endophyticus TaxID=1949083 RepID=UPI00249BD012|nr:FGGY-family carbohydrate kinase [Salinicola endophyticus]
MAQGYLMGLDGGSSSTKAVIFDLAGDVVGVGRQSCPLEHPQAHWVERDMETVWAGAAAAIRDALAQADVSASEILAVGVTAHGDGLYPVDRHGEALGKGITSLDSRAAGVVERWCQEGVQDQALARLGQVPFAFSPVALLAWMRAEQPERFAALGHVLTCKDWLRLKLTGEVATDFTEASSGYTDVQTQRYSREGLSLLGIEPVTEALPPIRMPEEIVGRVTAAAARATGLVAGTPVAAGLHDVTASALGLGNVDSDSLTIAAGTFSINEVFSDVPRPDARWATRNGLRPGQWLNMAISPASSSNLEWFHRQWGRPGDGGTAAFLADMEEALEEAFASDSRLVYHPFLYGSPYAEPASAGLFGLQGWHQRGHVLRAILEGVVCNHRVHVDALASRFSIRRTRITGGGSHSPRLAQLFADTLGREIETARTQEAAAWGAAICAGVGAGAFPSIAAAAALCEPQQCYRPDPQRQQACQVRFERYQQLVECLRPLWGMLDSEASVDASQTAAAQTSVADSSAAHTSLPDPGERP